MPRSTTLFTLLCLLTLLAACDRQAAVVAPDAPEVAEAAAFEQRLAAAIADEGEEVDLSAFRLEAAGKHHRVTYITGPTVISEPGIYRVAEDFTAADDAIVVRADHVLLLMAGRTLTGPGNKAGRGVVVEDARNVLVYGGTLETFGLGVVFLNTDRSAVKGVRIAGGDEVADPMNGIAPQIGTMLINSRRNVLLGNTYDQVNLGLFVRGGDSRNNRILLNEVEGGENGLLGICYNPAPGEGPAGPQHDRVWANRIQGFRTSIQASAGSEKNRFNRNTIYYLVSPYEDLNGTNDFSRNRTMQMPAI